MAVRPLDKNKVRRLLVRSTNWIGDAIMTTPAVRAIRKNFPDAEISVLAKPWVAPIFESNPYTDQILIYDTHAKHKGIIGKFRVGRELKPLRFDAAILLQNAFEAAVITFIAGIPARIGFNTDGRRFLLTHAVPCKPETKKIHQTDYYLEILRGVALETDGRHLDLVLSEADKLRATEVLRQYGVTEKDILVGINPSATFGPAKQWFPERFARLSDKISESFGTRILIFGGPGDIELGKKILHFMQQQPINLTGMTSLGEAMALIARCNLFITNDSGLMHVAAALDVPQVAIFGSTNSTTTGPMGSKSSTIQVPMACSPCLKPQCPDGHLNCMTLIDVDMVFEAVKGSCSSYLRG
ncbi:lipopolysaccharide heptosyltransferase II [Thermodesulfobacteriota bacterium]